MMEVLKITPSRKNQFTVSITYYNYIISLCCFQQYNIFIDTHKTFNFSITPNYNL